jgi:pyruvate/2-oxoglutarate dehydrogenase complex dihydrolipoamide acyltransferase (E2) component
VPFTFKLLVPALAEDALEGRLVQWFKPAGSFLFRGEIIAQVEVNQRRYLVESQVNFLLTKVALKPKAAFKTGDLLAHGEADGEELPYNRPSLIFKVSSL